MAMKKCFICGKARVPAHDPFCSDRCRQVDLNRWLEGHYRVPTEEAPSEETPEKGN